MELLRRTAGREETAEGVTPTIWNREGATAAPPCFRSLLPAPGSPPEPTLSLLPAPGSPPEPTLSNTDAGSAAGSGTIPAPLRPPLSDLFRILVRAFLLILPFSGALVALVLEERVAALDCFTPLPRLDLGFDLPALLEVDRTLFGLVRR